MTYTDFLPVELLPPVPGGLGLVVVVEPLVAGHHLLVSAGRAGHPAQQRVDVERVAAVGPALARDNTSQDYCYRGEPSVIVSGILLKEIWHFITQKPLAHNWTICYKWRGI